MSLVSPMPAASAAGVLFSTLAAAQHGALDERSLANITATSARPSVVAVASNAETESVSEVELDGTAQRRVRAANLANAASSDSAAGVNVLRDSSGFAGGDRDTVSSQRNEITQIVDDSARLAGFTRGPSLERDVRESGYAQQLETASALERRADREVTTEQTTMRFSASVLADGDGPFDGDGVSIQPDPIVVPGIVLHVFEGLTVDEEEVGAVSITLGNSVFRPGAILVQGENITVQGGTLELADFELDPLGSVDGPVVGLPSMTLPVENPLQDLRFSAGYAAFGSGELDTEPGEITLDVEIPLSLGRFFGDATVGIPDTDIVLTASDIGFPEIDFAFEESIPLELPPGFATQFSDEVTCLSAGPCGDVESSEVSRTEVDRSASTRETRTRTGSADFDRSETVRTRAAVEVSGAEARLQALDSSTLTENVYAVVIVADDAQAGIAALNAVNAARAVVGNGLNAASGRSSSRDVPRQARSGLSQRNTFLQIGGH